MSRPSLQDILREIEALDDQERLALDQELAARLQEQWEREASAARDEARRRGIDQAVIDRAIEHHRYGR